MSLAFHDCGGQHIAMQVRSITWVSHSWQPLQDVMTELQKEVGVAPGTFDAQPMPAHQARGATAAALGADMPSPDFEAASPSLEDLCNFMQSSRIADAAWYYKGTSGGIQVRKAR